MGPGHSLRNRLVTPRPFFSTQMNRSSDSHPGRARRADRSTYDRALDLLETRARSVVELRRASDQERRASRRRRRGHRAAARRGPARRRKLCAPTHALEGSGSGSVAASHRAGAGAAAEWRVTWRDKAIAEVFEDEGVDESANIERVARKRMKTLAKLDALTQRRRLYAFLARRGYDGDAISQIVGRLIVDETSAE